MYLTAGGSRVTGQEDRDSEAGPPIEQPGSITDPAGATDAAGGATTPPRWRRALRPILVLFAVFALAVVGGLYVIYRIETGADLAIVKAGEARIVRIGALRAAHEMDSLFSDVRLLGHSSLLRRWLRADDASMLHDVQQDFLVFATAKQIYDQVRFIDTDGKEIVRIDRETGAFSMTPRARLQDKAGRYYVTETLKLGAGRLYVSPLDLNVEQGVVETPVKPMLRFATPVFDRQGRKRGMVILNYRAANMLGRLRLLASSSEGAPWLLNKDGYWLMGPPGDEWAFMYPGRRDRTFAAAYPRAWQAVMKNDPAGQFLADGDLITYAKVAFVYSAPAAAPGKPAGSAWTFMTRVSSSRLAAIKWDAAQPFLIIAAFLLPAAAVAAAAFGHQFARRREAELKRIEAESNARSEKLASLIIESSPHSEIVVDGNGRIVRLNSATEELFGYQREELLGQKVEMLIPTRSRESHARLRRRFNPPDWSAYAKGKGRDLVARRKDGSEVFVEVGLGQMWVHGQRHIIASISDVTQRKLAEAELKASAERLARSNADLEQFAYAASHDLQEPLRSIGGMLQLLQSRYNSKLDDKGGSFIDHAVKGAERMQHLIDDLLTYSRAGRDAEIRQVDCNETMSEVVQALGARIRDTGARVTWKGLPTIASNPSLLFQLFQNLVANAIKFHDEAAPVVTVSAEDIGAGGWRFAVADNGIGIEAKFASDVFKVFRRLHTRKAYEGTGIGLALCRRIVEQHGGRIWVEPRAGGGSTFRFELAEDWQSGAKEAQG